MYITCKKQGVDSGSVTFRSENFHCAETFPDRVKISILRGVEGNTTPFYVSLGEWERVKSILLGTPEPTTNEDLANEYARGFQDGQNMPLRVLPDSIIEAFRKFEAAPYPSAQRDELKEDLIELIDNLIEAQEAR